ncbi:DegT/DnrJ/EryC1/StrS family aminotransferase, partial [Ornithobacterium rhinotracheale]
DEAIKQKAVFLATQARDDAPHYQHSQIGYNYRLSNICAGIGRGQMEVLAERVNQRRAMHAFYRELFKDFKDIQLLTEENENLFSNHWLSVILLKDYEQREKLRLALAEENIESRPLWKPMHMQPVFSNAMYFGEKVSEDAFNRGLCLPSGSNLTDEDRDRIKSCILHVLTQ